MVAHLDEDELPAAAVLAVQVDDGVSGGAGTGEVVEGGGGGVQPTDSEAVLDEADGLGIVERLAAEEILGCSRAAVR